MDTTLSTSTSQETLSNQMEAMGVKSNTSMITTGRDTPLPKENISNETLQLLQTAATTLSTNRRGVKRFREETPPRGEREQYPANSKPLYLKAKSLHKRKLAIAANIHQIKEGLASNKYPHQVNFRCSYPPNRDEKFKSTWQQIVKKCKEDLTYLVMQDLNSKYQETKAEISANLHTLNGILNQEQFNEIKKFLDERYKSAIPAAMNRASGKYNRKPPTSRTTKPNWKTRGQPPKKQFGSKKGKGQLKDVLTALLAQL